jgi:hypothetical protein
VFNDGMGSFAQLSGAGNGIHLPGTRNWFRITSKAVDNSHARKAKRGKK